MVQLMLSVVSCPSSLSFLHITITCSYSFAFPLFRINLKLSASLLPIWHISSLSLRSNEMCNNALECACACVHERASAQNFKLYRNRNHHHHHHHTVQEVKYKFCETVFTSRIICHFCIALRRRVESSWAPFDRFPPPSFFFRSFYIRLLPLLHFIFFLLILVFA